MPVIEAPTRSEDEALALVYAKAALHRRRRQRLGRRAGAGVLTATVGALVWLLMASAPSQHRAVYALPASLSSAQNRQVMAGMTERYRALGYGGVRTQLAAGTVRVEWQGGSDPAVPVVAELGGAGSVSLRPVVGTTPTPCAGADTAASPNLPTEAPDPSDPRQCLQLAPVALSDLVFTSTAAIPNAGTWTVRFTVAAQDVAAFDRVNTANLGHAVAIVVDGQVLSAPVVHNAAFHGQGQISGHLDQARAEALAVALKYGLPASLPVLSVG